MGKFFRHFFFLTLFVSFAPVWAHCGKDLSALVPDGDFLLRLFKEARAMSYVSDMPIGQNPFRKAKANPRHLSYALPLSSDEIQFIRMKEKKFRLTDDEIADYYMVKIYNEISLEKSRLLAALAGDNFALAKIENPSKEQLQLVKSCLQVINPELGSLSENDLLKAEKFLDEPLHIFSRKELAAILAVQERRAGKSTIPYEFQRAEQTELINAGLPASDSFSVINILNGNAIEPSACCQTFVTSVPCVGCGLNVRYNHLERERAKQGLPKLAVPPDLAVPKRLFIYQK